MDRYGSDKPDLRFGLPIVDLTQQLKGCGFSVFRKAIDEGGMVRAVNVKGLSLIHISALRCRIPTMNGATSGKESAR